MLLNETCRNFEMLLNKITICENVTYIIIEIDKEVNGSDYL